MMHSRVDIDKRKQELKSELAELEAEEARLLALSDDARLAEELHTLQCNWNHTDGCGWFYEIHKGVVDWSGWAHAQYLEKARKVMRALPSMEVDEIVKVVKVIK